MLIHEIIDKAIIKNGKYHLLNSDFGNVSDFKQLGGKFYKKNNLWSFSKADLDKLVNSECSKNDEEASSIEIDLNEESQTHRIEIEEDSDDEEDQESVTEQTIEVDQESVTEQTIEVDQESVTEQTIEEDSNDEVDQESVTEQTIEEDQESVTEQTIEVDEIDYTIDKNMTKEMGTQTIELNRQKYLFEPQTVFYDLIRNYM